MEKSHAQRAARFLIRDRGAKAAVHAQENLEWMLAHDDLEAAVDWRQILQAIADSQDADIAATLPVEESRRAAEGD